MLTNGIRLDGKNAKRSCESIYIYIYIFWLDFKAASVLLSEKQFSRT